MSTSNLTLHLSGSSPVSSPSKEDLPVILRHLNSDPEAYFLVEYPGGYLQGYEAPDQENTCYHLEMADQDEESGDLMHWQTRQAVPLETFAQMLTRLFESNESWRELTEWEVLDLSLPPDAEVGLGQFSPGDATRLLSALDEAGIPVRMEQISGTTFGLIVTAEYLDHANTVLAKVFNLQV